MKFRRLHWALYFLAWLLGVTVAGGIVGAGAFVVGGMLLDADTSLPALAVEGSRRVGFIFSIWAPAVALVACVKRAYESSKKA